MTRDACPLASGGASAAAGATYRRVIRAGHGVLRLLDVQERWAGLEHVPRTGPVVVVANHHSFADFAVVGHALTQRGRFGRFLCRADLWRSRPVGRALDAMGHVPVDFAAPAAAFLDARRLLEAGEAVVIFGQAGFGHSYTVERLMPGAAALARTTGAPLVPLAHWGSQRLWPVKRHPDAPAARPTPRRHVVVDVQVGPSPVPGASSQGDAGGSPRAVLSDARRQDVAATLALGDWLDATLTRLQALPEHRPTHGPASAWPTHPTHLGGGALTPAQATLLDRRPPGVVEAGWGSREPRPAP
ncbi:lysophospholipid acyltransferase family protein [Nocardioides sp. GY 10127]|uniref:lysophospholipid acyltransferase family protein n=1 Tax=Nocardioides sp. GY 10127 TaxID=2569762 RepID=UPI0010A82AD4|nr:lysophospholipid acyltransferase family protein [Nocardioides sp. GY 10127]TIC79939.1 1-acyl-sn-glycerol-3-phosphate acyltransferase [Nocardioides sp. GY 10127]